MTLRIATLAALVFILVPSSARCDGAASPRDVVSGKFYPMVGWFEPVEGGLTGHTAVNMTYSWQRSSLYATIEYTRSTHGGTIDGFGAGFEDQAYTLIGGARLWQKKWYCGAGVGLSSLREDITVLPFGTVASSDTHFAWEVVAGAPFGGRGLAEIKYVDAGDSSARGFVVFVGVTY